MNKGPTLKQIIRRLRNPPRKDSDPRVKNDPYWALRWQGHPHAYAKRALRSQPVRTIQGSPIIDYENEYIRDVDPEDLLVTPANVREWRAKPEVVLRPETLTEQLVKDAQPIGMDEYTIWDGTVPALGLRIRPTGHKTFILYYRVRGRRKRSRKLTIGAASAITLEKARKMARGFLGDARAGKDPAEKFRKGIA